MPAESNPAAMLAFDAAVIRAQAPRIGDKPLPPSTLTTADDANAAGNAGAATVSPQGAAA